MRDRARAKSAESTLYHIHTNVANVFETAMHDQEKMLQRIRDVSSSKLARIQVAFVTAASDLNVCIKIVC